MLKIDNLHATVDDKAILNGLTLEVKAGEVHAIMGPNGSGKSTLAQVLAGRELYAVTAGSITYDGKDLLELSPEDRGKALPYILTWAEASAKLSGVDVIRGFNATMAIRAAAAKLFHDLDYVISPVSPVVNFPAEFAAPINDPDKPFEHIAYTVPWNMAENPAISINGGYDAKGFPIGVQIVGRRFDDLGVLGMAKAFEGLRGPQRPWPSPPKK